MPQFQAISWETVDIRVSMTELHEPVRYIRNDTILVREYTPPVVSSFAASKREMDAMAVRVAGKTEEGVYTSYEIRGFRPYFYVHIHDLPGHTVDDIVTTMTQDFRFKQISIYRVGKIPFVGYHVKEETFLRIECISKRTFLSARFYLRNLHESLPSLLEKPLLLYESMCDPLVQFWIAYRTHPMTWIHIDCRLPTNVKTDQVTFLQDIRQPAPFKCLHYDLECFSSVAYSTKKNNMPNPTLEEDVIIGIGVVVTTSTSSAIDSRVYFGIHPLRPEDPSFEGVQVFAYDNEKDMLSGFCTWFDEQNPDMWNGFNNFGFDDRYLFTRLKLYDIQDEFPSRDVTLQSKLIPKLFSSNALKFEAEYLHLPLRFYMDLLTFARKEFAAQMSKFSLENVAMVLLNEGKHDVSPWEIFDAWATQDESKLTRVGAYCIQDCVLVARIMEHKDVLSTILSRSELFLCDPRDLLLKGQQQIVFNLIYQQTRTQTNFCIPDSAENAIEHENEIVRLDNEEAQENGRGFTIDQEEDIEDVEEVGEEEEEEEEEDPFVPEQLPKTNLILFAEPLTKASRKRSAAAMTTTTKVKFQGATVLEPKRGAYMCPVSGLDFASLYPSIMTAYNLCHSTKLLTPEAGAGIPDQHLYSTVISGGRVATFVQKEHRRGVLPQILLNLWAMRKVLKKQMAKAKEDGERNMQAIFNAKQLAVKVAMNSIYGFCGASQGGKLPMKDIAETVTANGRFLIERSKAYVESWYPCEVVYGDTDSIYVRFYLDSLPLNIQNPTTLEEKHELLKWVFQRSQEAADRISAEYIKPIELEFEKVMFPFVLFNKKRYIYIEYEKYDEEINPDNVNMKGIAPTRRDTAPFVKRVCIQAIENILYDRSVDMAFEYVERELKSLLRGEFPKSEMVISKSVSKKLEMYASQKTPHIALARKIEERTGVPTAIGDRIQYVFKKGTGQQCDLVEEPQFVQEAQVDGNYYYQRQIRNPLLEILGTIDKPRWLALDEKLCRLGNMLSKGLQDISTFFVVNEHEFCPPLKKQFQETIIDESHNQSAAPVKRQVSILHYFTKK